MNILFTCAGRRNYLLRFFRDELAGEGRILAADLDPTAPAMQEADQAFVVPRVAAPDYIPVLLALCKAEAVDLVISLNDLELPVLAQHRSDFEAVGTRVLVSRQEVVDTCFDKLATNAFLERNGIVAPLTFTDLDAAMAALDAGTVSFPLVVKPRWGSASIQLYKVHARQELEYAFRLATIQLRSGILAEVGGGDPHSILIQEGLPGNEYGLDILNDLQSQVRCVYVKQKLGMRAGETEKSRLVQHPVLLQLGERLGTLLGHVGNLDCDVFLNGENAVVLELNPRFGGGYPFSHVLGANYPRAIIAWCRGTDIDVSAFERNQADIVSKCDQLVVVTSANRAS